jgi:hypothetical protein
MRNQRFGEIQRAYALALGLVALGGCSSSSASVVPSQGGTALVRFVDGAPSLETIEGSTPQNICPVATAPCYLQVNGKSVTQDFYYGSISRFTSLPAGTLSLVARDVLGYSVGPIKTTALAAGKSYTIIVVGAYPDYSALTFDEPASTGAAQLSLYEASPAVPQSGFGSFRASTKSDFKQLGTATLGNVATVTLGKSVTDFGGYAGPASSPYGAFTLSQINAFDKHDVLPFNAATRLSLFLFDNPGSTTGEVFATLDQ